MRQKDLARALGCSQSFVSNYESGQHRLDFPEIRHICDVLAIAYPRLFRRFEVLLKEDRLPDSKAYRRIHRKDIRRR